MEITIKNNAVINPTGLDVLQNTALVLDEPRHCPATVLCVEEDFVGLSVNVGGTLSDYTECGMDPMVTHSSRGIDRRVWLSLEGYRRLFGTSFDKLVKTQYPHRDYIHYQASAYFCGVEFYVSLYSTDKWDDIPTEWERLF